MRERSISKAFTLIESGPVALVTTHGVPGPERRVWIPAGAGKREGQDEGILFCSPRPNPTLSLRERGLTVLIGNL